MERAIRPGRLRSEEGDQEYEEGAAGLEEDGMSVRPGRYSDGSRQVLLSSVL